ncbi:hypothetical protein EMPS_06221 [Entomortierella parvispora]|uniref:Uncharacterized protein n=1 Tax=Entomortierella parvispora TaxID=205924 RepID=A0A9P3HCI4_9FUNG|nr:hypothetical protein EMPS_06221 [Entomortierella parvispora]
MDQDIEARAKEFLSFLERCSKQDRAAATASITSCLPDLQAFLEQIQPHLQHLGESITKHQRSLGESHDTIDRTRAGGPPSQLYPTLGPLLYRLCRNPVVLSSKAIDCLLIQAVVGYSCQTGTRDYSDWTSWQKQHVREQKSKAEAWCTARLKDIFMTDRDPGSKLDPFEDLFLVSTEEMKEREFTELFSILARKLQLIVDALAKSDREQTHRKALPCWTFGLSGLCSPLVGDVRSQTLVAGVVDLAFSLSRMGSKKSRDASLDQVLDPTFVDSVRKQQDCVMAAPYCLDNKRLMKLWTISPLIRQQVIVRCITRSLETFAGQQHLSSLNMEDPLTKHAESSRFLVAMTESLDMGCYPVELFLQSLTEIAAEVPDWRFSRLCSLLVKWTLQNGKDYGGNPVATFGGDLITDVLSTARGLLGKAGTKTDISCRDTTLTQLQEAGRRYILQSKGPTELTLRRRLLFLVSAACWTHRHLLLLLISKHFKELEVTRLVETKPSVIPAIIAELFLECDTDQYRASLVYHVQSFLKELYIISSAYCEIEESRTSFDSLLSAKLGSFRSVLSLNAVVMADLICALGLYMSQGGPIPWQAMFSAVRTTIYPSTTPSMFATTPFMVRICDIQRSSSLPGLSEAIEQYTLETEKLN